MTRPGSRHLGSITVRRGFKNENEVIAGFNHWQTDPVAQHWLVLLGHQIEKIVAVRANQITGSYKADISVKVDEGDGHLLISFRLSSSAMCGDIIKLTNDGLIVIANCGIFHLMLSVFSSCIQVIYLHPKEGVTPEECLRMNFLLMSRKG
jgi:hypothetical protein